MFFFPFGADTKNNETEIQIKQKKPTAVKKKVKQRVKPNISYTHKHIRRTSGNCLHTERLRTCVIHQCTDMYVVTYVK